jgi:predicted phosphodiesterase
VVTVDDLVVGKALPEPMVVTVVSVDWNAGPSRRAVVDLVDKTGNDLQLIDYEGAKLEVDWTPEYRYRIARCNVNRGGSNYAATLEPGTLTRIEPLGPIDDGTSLLVVGDTHVGRTKHPKTEDPIDPIDAFAKAVEYGVKRDVDAVVHVGDIFHETASSSEASAVESRIFDPLETASIPFYYVSGNHSIPAGESVLAKRTGVAALDTNGNRVGSDVRVFGIDHHEGGALPWNSIVFPITISESISILVLHQTLRQLPGSDLDSVDVGRLQKCFSGQFDLVVSGHHHDATIKDWNGTTVMYTGATERMSKNSNPVDRVAWLVSTEETPLIPDRYEIPE